MKLASYNVVMWISGLLTAVCVLMAIPLSSEALSAETVQPKVGVEAAASRKIDLSRRVERLEGLIDNLLLTGSRPIPPHPVGTRIALVNKITDQTSSSTPVQAVMTVWVIKDVSNSLKQFKTLQANGYWHVVDSEMLHGILEILSKNGLIETIANPTVVTTTGRPAQFKVGNSKAGTDIRLNWLEADNSIRIGIKAEIKNGGQTLTIDATTETNPGSSTVLRIGSPSPCYLVITPELVQP